MSEQLTTEALEDALRELARDLETPVVDDSMLNRVQVAIASAPVPTRSPVKGALETTWLWSRARTNWLVALVAGALLTGLTISPVGAEVADWFGFHGVFVVEQAGEPAGQPSVPPVNGSLPLEQAAREAGFVPQVPTSLGEPDAVEADAQRQLVSMSWGSPETTVRLDQFKAELSPLFWKSTRKAELVQLDSGEGLWFPVPHEVVVLGPGGEVTVPSRLAATTLIWPHESRTLRLEGTFTRTEAIQIANSIP